MFQAGERQTSVHTPTKPRLCMKRFPEFSQRQNIKEMFRKLSATKDSNSLASVGKVTPPSSAGRPVKRPRSSPSSPAPRNNKEPKLQGQQTLRGFFKPVLSNVESGPSASSSGPAAPRRETGRPRLDGIEGPSSKKAGDLEDDNRVVDPIDSKEQWNLLFSKRPPPVCDTHGEACIQLTTTKPGPNYGRAFWICQRCAICILCWHIVVPSGLWLMLPSSRPIGPEGQSVIKSGRKTEWKCNFFKWASDMQ
jgi:AP endonuclease-2